MEKYPQEDLVKRDVAETQPLVQIGKRSARGLSEVDNIWTVNDIEDRRKEKKNQLNNVINCLFYHYFRKYIYNLNNNYYSTVIVGQVLLS